MTNQTLFDVLLDRAESRQAVILIHGQGQHQRLPYSELLGRAHHRLLELQSRGLQPGSQLIIQSADYAQFLEAFWACLLGGITAVPVAGGNSVEHRFKLFRIAEKLDRPGLFTDTQTLSRLTDFAGRHSLQGQFRQLEERAVMADRAAPQDASARVHAPQPQDTAFIQFSSGSTSTPKGVVLSHRNLITNLRAIVRGTRMSKTDHQFSWMPLTHDMGLIGFHLTPVFMDNDHSLMPTELFVRRPALWLSESAALGATLLCSPNFGYQHLLKSFKDDRASDLDLSSVRLIFNGAEPIAVSLCHRFMQTLAPHGLKADAMLPVYGLAEASLAVTFPSLDVPFSTLSVDRAALGIGEQVRIRSRFTGNPGDWMDRADDTVDQQVEFVSEGCPVDDVELQIRAGNGGALDERVTGHIHIRGASVTEGYYQEPELNDAVIDGQGWLDTGDLGFVHEGQLYITGRAKDIIFVNGQNVYPHDLEEIILEAGLTERGRLAVSSQHIEQSGDENLLVFVQHRGAASELADTGRAITRLLAESAGVAVHAVVPVARIPKTTSGKVQRYLLVESYRQGEFEALVQSRQSIIAVDGADADTEARLLAICNAQVEHMSVAAGDNLFELGISSLTLAQIHAAIEECWPEQVDITDLFDYPTVAELARLLDERSAA